MCEARTAVGSREGDLECVELGVDHARKTLSRKKSNMAKRGHTLAVKADAVRKKDRAKVQAEREVTISYYCLLYLFAPLPCIQWMSLTTSLP